MEINKKSYFDGFRTMCDICPHGSTAVQCATKDGCEINDRYIALRKENEQLQARVKELESDDTVPRSRYNACNKDWIDEKEKHKQTVEKATAHISALEKERDELKKELLIVRSDFSRVSFNFKKELDRSRREWYELARKNCKVEIVNIDTASYTLSFPSYDEAIAAQQNEKKE